MALVLPIAVWISVSVAWLGNQRPAREAALVGFSAVAVAILVFSELLSPLHALAMPWLAFLWSILLASVLVTGRRYLVNGWRRLPELSPAKWGGWEWATGAVLFVFAVGTMLSALLYPTTNYDSLTYHMPRVFFWFQNHSVAHYPTSEGRQLFSSAHRRVLRAAAEDPRGWERPAGEPRAVAVVRLLGGRGVACSR